MEEKEDKASDQSSGEERFAEIDLNHLFPGKGYDLNRLFPDDATRRLLHQVKKNKRDIERFIKNLSLEEE